MLQCVGRKGWQALAACDIRKGQFVAEYAGELVRNDEAARRLAVYDAEVDAPGHALLVNPRIPDPLVTCSILGKRSLSFSRVFGLHFQFDTPRGSLKIVHSSTWGKKS